MRLYHTRDACLSEVFVLRVVLENKNNIHIAALIFHNMILSLLEWMNEEF